MCIIFLFGVAPHTNNMRLYVNDCIIYFFLEKGICISTVSLWILLVYTEASLRLKDLKTSHANLSHLFAAHWYVAFGIFKTSRGVLMSFNESVKYSIILYD